MSRFREKGRQQVPGLNLAALPDLIFTVLFFFMIVTHMRQVDPKVRYQLPQGTEVMKDVRKAGVVYIIIGERLAVDGERSTASDGQQTTSLIQLNDELVSVEEIPAKLNQLREKMSEDERQHLTVCIRADRNTEMGIINDVKQALRKAGALNINYSALKRKE